MITYSGNCCRKFSFLKDNCIKLRNSHWLPHNKTGDFPLFGYIHSYRAVRRSRRISGMSRDRRSLR